MNGATLPRLYQLLLVYGLLPLTKKQQPLRLLWAQPLGHSPQKPLQLGGSVELSWGRPAHLHIASASNRSDSNASGVGRSCVEGWPADR